VFCNLSNSSFVYSAIGLLTVINEFAKLDFIINVSLQEFCVFAVRLWNGVTSSLLSISFLC